VYFCTLEDCHFKIETALALGKRVICNLCGDEFVMSEYHIKLARPHCDSCSKTKVRGSDGQNHYIRKTNIQLLDSVAESTTDNLRSRLDLVAGMVSEEDI
jgi:hypothetical protein